MKASWVVKTFFALAIAASGFFTLLGGGVYFFFSRGLPKIIEVSDYKPLGATRIYAKPEPSATPVLLAEYYKEKRYLIPYEKIPKTVVQAFISAEDDRFFEHQGINLASIVRAAIANLKAGHVVQGGSTITQQVAKSLLLTPERSFDRKIKELILAARIEKNLSKEQILYLYLNQIYLGHGAYGVQAATQAYFGKDISNITLGEAAMMGGLPQAPGKYSPHLNSKKAKERQLYVLRRMMENHFISQQQMAEAIAQPLRIYSDEREELPKIAPYLTEHVRRYLIEKYGEKVLYEDGLTVVLQMDPQLAQVASKSLREGLREVDKRSGFRGAEKRLKEKDIEKVLQEQRAELIEKRLGYEYLMPDGRLDLAEAVKGSSYKSEAALLVENEIYKAVVAGRDDKKKVVFCWIGSVKAAMPYENTRWAFPLGSRIELSRGDVIRVKILKNNDEVTVALDQEPQIQGALISFDVKTGRVLAMEGGLDYDKSEFNRAIQAQRQPGSAFKPIIYSYALEKGFTPATIIVDSPIVYEDTDNGKWKPSNFEEKFYGDTTFRQALIKSRNIPTIKILQSVQVQGVLRYVERIGLNGKFNPDLSMSLGSGAVSLYEITKAYGVFPRLGRKLEPYFISQVMDRDGKILEEAKPKVFDASHVPTRYPTPEPSASGLAASLYPLPEDPAQVIDPRIAYVMTHLMKEVVNYGTGYEARALARPAAGKTGTTNDYLDGWFVGFTADVVTGVWVGYDNQKPIGKGETGAKVALPIWLNFMKEAVKPYPERDFPVPPGIAFTKIDPLTGKLAPPQSTRSIQESFVQGTEPTEMTTENPVSAPTQSGFFKEDI